MWCGAAREKRQARGRHSVQSRERRVVAGTRGYRSARGLSRRPANPSGILFLVINGPVGIELVIDRTSIRLVARIHRASPTSFSNRRSRRSILDLEDSITAAQIDAQDKVLAYSNWLGPSCRGALAASFSRGASHDDAQARGRFAGGSIHPLEEFTVPGRALLFVLSAT